MIEIHSILKSLTGTNSGFHRDDTTNPENNQFSLTGVKYHREKSKRYFSYGLPEIPFG